MIKIIIAEDQKMIRKALKMMLKECDEIEVVGEAYDGVNLISLYDKGISVDLILLDIRMPNIDGLEAIKILRKKGYDGKILLLTTFNEVDYIVESLKYDISGYLLKSGDIDYLVSNIKKAYEGELVFDSDVVHNLVEIVKREKEDSKSVNMDLLTERENEIANLIVKGYSNKQISDKLFISVGTVKNVISNIYRKLNINKRTMLNNFIK